MRIILAALLFALATLTYAGEITVAAGVSRSSPHGDGIWYQDPFPHYLHLNSAAATVRWDAPVNDDWSMGFGYAYLAKISSSAKANALDGRFAGDHGYNASTRGCNGTCLPLSQYNGAGVAQGIFGAATRHVGPWAFEGGVSLLHPTWVVNVPDWTPCMTCTPTNITVAHRARLQPDLMLGVGYRDGPWSVKLSVWQTASQGDDISSLYMQTYTLLLGRSW